MNRLGLRTKLLVGNMALVLMLTAFFAFYMPHQQGQAAKAALERRAEAVALTLASVAATSVDTEELGGAETLARDVKHAGEADSDLLYLVVRRMDGSIITQYQAPDYRGAMQARDPSQASTFDDGGLHTVEKIRLHDQTIGTLQLGTSTATIDKAVGESRTNALIVSIAVLLVGSVIIVLLARSIAKPILTVADNLEKLSEDLVTNARSQEASSAEEAAVVAQTRQSMETLLMSAQEIASQSSEVLGNAERTASGNRKLAARFGDLSQLSDRVAEILATIMQIADRADLLALNASLEGTRAGDAGKGFTLVAAEMRRLAENIMDSVSGIRALMTEMRTASQAAESASDKGQELSQETAVSAQQIALLTQEQRQSTEQVMASMDEMSNVLHQALLGVQQSTLAAESLAGISQVLADMINPSSSDASDSPSKDLSET